MQKLNGLSRKNKPTKNVNVQEIKAYINFLLERDFTQEEKKAYCLILQEILFASKQYNGFNYIKWIHGGYEKWVNDGKPEDNTAYSGQEYDRFYY